MQKVFLLVGVPGSGKTWVVDRIKDKFHIVQNDDYINEGSDSYIEAIKDAARESKQPVIAEAPFSMMRVLEPLQEEGIDTECVFIIEDPEVLAERYFKRSKNEIPKGHLTRMNTFAQRAKAMGAFSGNSTQVMEHLRNQ